MRTKPIQTIIRDIVNHIVYIEYHDGKPHEVITLEDSEYGKHKRLWDFDLNMNWGEYMYYNHGGGGDIKNEYGPQFVEGTKGVSIWVAECLKFNKKYPPKNCRIIKNPLRISKGDGTATIDPFKFAYDEVSDIIYCEDCEGYYNEGGCSQHMDMWEYKYLDGREIE